MIATKPEPEPMPWEWRFLGPRHLHTWALLGLLRGAALLPAGSRARLGARFGRVLLRLMRSRRRIARANIELCFPELDPAARERLLRAHFEALGQAFADMGGAWWASEESLRRCSSVSGLHHLERALARGRGALLVSGHFTTMEMAVRILTLYMPAPFLYSIYRPSKDRLFDRAMLRGRSGQPAVMVPRDDVRGLLAALRSGAPVCFFPDQDHGVRHAVFVPFLGVPAATITTTARFARMSGSPVVPYFLRLRPGGGYALQVLPELEEFPSGDAERDAARVSSLIEAEVRADPAAYLWIHRRFKTRPEGAPPVY